MDICLHLDCSGGIPVVAVRGEIDMSTAPKLDRRLQEVAGEGHKEVQVDLSGVDYMDSEGLKVLIRLRNTLGDDGEVVISGARDSVSRVLRISGVDRIFKVID